MALLSHRWFRYAAVFFLWGLATCFLIFKEVKLPATDVFLFKEAGVRWAQSGQFEASNLPHMPPNKSLLYAYYPPLYPLSFGMWSKVFGVGLKQSIAFDSLLRLARTLLLLGLVGFWIRKQKKDVVFGWPTLLLCLLSSLISSDGDRPDELALVFGLASWLAALRAKPLLGALLLGFCGASSPAAGVLFALGYVLRSLRTREFRSLGVTAGISVLVFFVCNFSFYTEGLSAIERFRAQAKLSNFPYQSPFSGGLFGFVDSYLNSLGHSFEVGLPYMLGFIGLMLVVLFWTSQSKQREKRILRSHLLIAAGYSIPCLIVWTLQPYYFWFPIVILLGVTLYLMNQRPSRVPMTLALLALVPLLGRESKAVLHNIQLPQTQSSKFIARKILKEVGPQARLAVDHDQYFTFRPYREVDNIAYVCSHIRDYDYIYATPKTAKRERSRPTPIKCSGAAGCFSLVRDFSSTQVFELLGRETSYFVRGHGGALYKNTACKKKG